MSHQYNPKINKILDQIKINGTLDQIKINGTLDQIKINGTLDQLIDDIKITKDPVKRVLLKRFIDIKMNETTNMRVKSKKNVDQNKKILDNILRQREDSLKELDKLKESKTEQKDEDEENDILVKNRGKNEKLFKNNNKIDSKYIKYIETDQMNNKLMERLNSEIDFRSEGINKSIIEKPFDENENEYL